MCKIKLKDLKAKEVGKRDFSYLVDVFNRMQADVTEEEIILPSILATKIEELNLPEEVYDYFSLVWSNEKKEVEISDVVGSHDFRNVMQETFLKNMMQTCTEENLNKYLENPRGIIENSDEPFLLFEKDGKYYIADGHHRLSTLFVHYHILKSKNLPVDHLPTTFPAIVRVIPKNMEFLSNFRSFVYKNKLYDEDEIGIIPYFTLVDSNHGYPKIKFDGTDFLIDENTDLEEALLKIKEQKRGLA